MRSLLVYVPSDNPGSDEASVISKNFETAESITRLHSHICQYIPDLTVVNVADPEWFDKVGDRAPFNYTYGFGLLKSSAGPTALLEGSGRRFIGTRLAGLHLSANKPHMSNLIASLGYRRPKHELVSSPISDVQAARITSKLSPSEYLVLKPAYEESSIGLSLVQNSTEDIVQAIADLYRWFTDVSMLEQYIAGVDVTVPIIGRDKPQCLPALALRHDKYSSEPYVFSADAKARKDGLQYVPISHWPSRIQSEILNLALEAFRLGEQRDWSRLDCRVTPSGECYFLEINANPQIGLGKASFAVSADAAGQTLGEVIARIVELAEE